jgi:pimeloyl-ACP methyl ester carboxylesterase
MDDKFVTLDGIRTRYREQGEGPVVILLHGASLGSSAEVWEATMPPLAARGLRVLAPDWPGFGLTAIPPDHSAAYKRGHILRFMDAVGANKATLAGHSMAGTPAVQLAFANPERVEKVVIVGTGTLLPPLPDKPVGRAGEEVHSEPSIEDTRADLEANAFDHARLTPELVKRRHELSIGRNFEAALARQAAAPEVPAGPPLWQRLDQIPVPALFMYGKQDRASAAERAAIACERYPTLKLHMLEGCRHLVPYDKPDEMVNLIAGFVLGQVPSGVR